MNFDIPEEMQAYLEELDQFIEKEIKRIITKSRKTN